MKTLQEQFEEVKAKIEEDKNFMCGQIIREYMTALRSKGNEHVTNYSWSSSKRTQSIHNILMDHFNDDIGKENLMKLIGICLNTIEGSSILFDMATKYAENEVQDID